MSAFDLSRRQVLKGSAAAMAVGAIGSLGALYSRQALAATDPTRMAPIPSPYGDARSGRRPHHRPAAAATAAGLPLPVLRLDRRPHGRRPCRPDRHDGMAVMQGRGHALRPGERPWPGPRSGTGADPQPRARRRDVRSARRACTTPATSAAADAPAGGTTTLRWRDGQWLGTEASLGGTLVNCAGGPTPWGTWLSCEEIKSDAVSSSGRKHGYVFEVRSGSRPHHRPPAGAAWAASATRPSPSIRAPVPST